MDDIKDNGFKIDYEVQMTKYVNKFIKLEKKKHPNWTSDDLISSVVDSVDNEESEETR